ncbi:MAG: TIR domain-containing protein [Nocardioides sp.]
MPIVSAVVSGEKLRVFISWSGDLSKVVATAVREWLPSLFDRVDPWMSDLDIASGARGLEEIHTTLANCSFGVIIVTDENQGSAWLNYESGAISKSIADSASRVVPLLVDLSGPTQLTGPLAQFQARKLDEQGVLRLVETLADQLGVPPDTARQRFEAFWPQLERSTKEALASRGNVAPAKTRQRPMVDMLEEVLAQVRELTRVVDLSRALTPSRMDYITLSLTDVMPAIIDLLPHGDPAISGRARFIAETVDDVIGFTKGHHRKPPTSRVRRPKFATLLSSDGDEDLAWRE